MTQEDKELLVKDLSARLPYNVLVHIYDIKILDINLPEVKFEVTCSKGTYIRSLIRDIGDALLLKDKEIKAGAYMKDLIRTKVSRWEVKDALKLSEIEDKVKNNTINDYILTVEDALFDYPGLKITAEYDSAVRNGNKLPKSIIDECLSDKKKDLIRVYDSKNTFIGLYQIKGDEYKPYKMFY